MRLTSLEIKGFKSFADKTTIHFNESITGIVGPNGCGKSNVVDSIRWVLGEQKTSQLRLEKMDNLIFNGTKKRKASGLAEVSLTFENTKNILATEFKTVTITRRLFRNGDSEYRLNDIPCRLKDISNLFMDTGISNDSYAIIELGMVDEILNDRDHSRRKLFEQASGISKYKIRKKETLNKLKGTEKDLERVEDLLFEIEGNLKTLESQARKTKKFYRFKEEYKELSLELAKQILTSYKERYKSLEAKQKNEETTLIEVSAKSKDADAKLEKEKLQNLEKEKALAVIQKKLNELTGGVSSKENERNLLREQIKFETEKNENASQQLVESKQLIEVLKNEIEKIELNKIEQAKILDKKEKEVNFLKETLDTNRTKHNVLKASLDGDKKAFQTIEARYYEIEKKVAVNTSAKEKYETDLFHFQEENTNKEKEFKTLSTDFKTAEKEKTEQEKNLTNLIAKQEKLKAEKESLEKQLKTFKDENARKNRILDAKLNEYNLTKSLVDSLEGFPESIRFLKKNDSWAKDAPLLSDIIYCSEEYRISIENFLEPYLNYYVVDTKEEALKAIHLLSDSAKGKANFFVLEDFVRFKSENSLLNDNLLLASSVIEFDERFKNLASFLLNNVYYIKNEAEAEALIQEKKLKDVTLLSKSGKYLKKQFSIAGGAVGLFEGKRIGRAKNLEKLDKEVKKLQKETSKILLNISDVTVKIEDNEAKSFEQEIKTQRQIVNTALQKFSSLQAKSESLEKFLQTATAKSKNVEEAIKTIVSENAAMEQERKELTSERERLRESVSKNDNVFVELTDKLNNSANDFNQNNILFHQEKNKLNSIVQELNFKQKQLETNQEQIGKNKNILETSSSTIKENREKLQKLDSELLSGYEDKEGFEKEVIKAEQTYYDSRALINDLETSAKEIQYKKQNVDTLLRDIKDKFTDLKLEFSSMKERLSIEFEVDINVIINETINDSYSREELEEKVEKLKHKISNFGEINPMAVEAFDEMKKRYDFIQEQKKDLLNAKDVLEKTIKEIDDTAKEKFMAAFNEVRENFIKVFRTLFTEDDKCDLILEDENNPLESKIEIIAKPKGKRPTVIDQLSGGEKTLTATALLFSLYLLKPAPFCIFDEVDAPLDDTNIDKFNNIIQEFSDRSQFIIVTHNKQTMGKVDVIYGVTMQEQGVSKVVPVDFRALAE
ncbi:MAG: chromosome segregation protein SMC [Chitinophagales bacterium]